MSKSNPVKAISALIPAPIPVPGTGESVRPLTLAVYAVLDRIGSPLVRPQPCTILDLIPSLYILCKGYAEALQPGLGDKAMAWADTLPPAAMALIKQAAEKQIMAMLDVLPTGADCKKKAATAG